MLEVWTDRSKVRAITFHEGIIQQYIILYQEVEEEDCLKQTSPSSSLSTFKQTYIPE